MSQATLRGRATPRWSLAGGGQSGLPASIAGLLERRACVSVEPGELSARGLRFAAWPVMLEPAAMTRFHLFQALLLLGR